MQPCQKQREQHQGHRNAVHQGVLPGQEKSRCTDGHDADLAQLDRADDLRLVAHVRQLTGDRGHQDERPDEQPGRDRAEDGFRLGVAVNGVNHEQDHRGLVEIVVESVEQLCAEQRQKAPPSQQSQRRHKSTPARLAAPLACAALEQASGMRKG